MGEALTAGAGRWHGPDTAEGPSAGSDQTAVPHESVGSRDGCPTNQAGIPALQVAGTSEAVGAAPPRRVDMPCPDESAESQVSKNPRSEAADQSSCLGALVVPLVISSLFITPSPQQQESLM